MKRLMICLSLLMGLTMLHAQEVKDVNDRANFKELAFVAPEPAIMIATYDADGTPDVMMAAWGCQSDFNQIKIHLSEHKTTANLRLKKAFTVSFATVPTLAESDYLGTVSADKSVLDVDGNIDMGKMQIVAFDQVTNTYRKVGDVVGKAWSIGEKFK